MKWITRIWVTPSFHLIDVNSTLIGIILRKLIVSYLDINDMEDAETYLSDLMNLEPANPRNTYLAALFSVHKGDKEAFKCYLDDLNGPEKFEMLNSLAYILQTVCLSKSALLLLICRSSKRKRC